MRLHPGPLLLWACTAAFGCGATSVRPPEATLAVRCADVAALVYVDDEAAGSALDSRTRALPLDAGAHRVEVRAQGKLAAYRDVRLRAGEHATLSVTLRPDLDATDGDSGPPRR